MVRKRFINQLAAVLVIAFGIFIFWHFTPFRPLDLRYPPQAPFQLLSSDSVLAKPGKQYQASLFKNFWLGEHLRPLWTTPVHVGLFQEKARLQGLRAVKRGGGMQTTSFTLADEKGNLYALRSIDKNPAGVLKHKGWWNTLILGFVRDQVSATDPYAMLVVSRLAQVAQISRSEPEIGFVKAGDPFLGKFAGASQGFFSLELKQEDPEWLTEAGETFTRMYETAKMQPLLKDSRHEVRLDTARYLRCRLFDLLIGDWDRHAGQWSWLAFQGEDYTIFRPVPKDRDQALGYYQDGVLPWVLSRRFAVRKISSFTEEFEDVDGFLENGRVLDQWLIKSRPEREYEEIANSLKEVLTDQVLEEAVRKYPPVFAQTRAREVFRILQKRRDNLPQAARLFYRNVQNPNR